MRISVFGLSLILTVLLASSASAGSVLFSEDFNSGLGVWTGKNGGATSGQIVTDPTGGTNQVLNFSNVTTGGDIFSSIAIPTAGLAGPIKVEFDYYGTTDNSQNASAGGYVGVSQGLPGTHSWIAGTAPTQYITYGNGVTLVDNGAWAHYSIDITPLLNAWSSPSIHLMLEDFAYSGNKAGNAYFDNIALIDGIPPTGQSTPTPEPASLILLSLCSGLGLAYGARRRHK